MRQLPSKGRRQGTFDVYMEFHLWEALDERGYLKTVHFRRLCDFLSQKFQ